MWIVDWTPCQVMSGIQNYCDASATFCRVVKVMTTVFSSESWSDWIIMNRTAWMVRRSPKLALLDICLQKPLLLTFFLDDLGYNFTILGSCTEHITVSWKNAHFNKAYLCAVLQSLATWRLDRLPLLHNYHPIILYVSTTQIYLGFVCFPFASWKTCPVDPFSIHVSIMGQR